MINITKRTTVVSNVQLDDNTRIWLLEEELLVILWRQLSLLTPVQSLALSQYIWHCLSTSYYYFCGLLSILTACFLLVRIGRPPTEWHWPTFILQLCSIRQLYLTNIRAQLGDAENAGLKNAGPENAGPMMSSLRDQKCSTRKCRTGKYRTWNMPDLEYK